MMTRDGAHITGTLASGTAMLWGMGAGLFMFIALYNFARSLASGAVSVKVVLVFLGLLPGVHAGEISVHDVPTRPKVTVRVLLIKPDRPQATVLLFAGGRGIVNLAPDGSTTNGNFLVRSREEFVKHGLMTAVMDAPSDRFFAAPDGSGTIGLGFGFRRSSEHVEDIRAVIDFLRAQAKLPLWLVGTSRGSTSVAFAAINIRNHGPDGIVLTSSILVPVPPAVTPSDGDSLLRVTSPPPAMDLSQIFAPTLVMHHVNDQCPITPYAGVKPLLERLTSTIRQEIWVKGGSEPQGDPCGAFHYHGFIGIEAAVVARMAQRVKHGLKAKP